MGSIISTSRVSWDGDGSELGAAGPVQGATRPWFETDVVNGTLTVDMHAGYGTGVERFALTNGTLRHISQGIDAGFVTLYTGRDTVQVAAALIDTLARGSTSDAQRSETYFANESGLYADAGQILMTQVNGQSLVVMSSPGRSGLTTFSYDGGDGTAGSPRARQDTSDIALSDPAALASVVLGAQTFVFATSSSEAGLSAFRMNTSGTLNPLATLSAEDGLWISNATTLVATTVAGASTDQSFLLLGAAGSGSLTVVAVDGNGAMQVVDHVLDDLKTRFGNITALEVLATAAGTYVAVAGGDDGVSLYRLLPNGQLVHLETLADTQVLGLDNISALSLSYDGGFVHLVASSETEAGLTYIVYDPGSGVMVVGDAGANTLTGTVNDDILLDGAGVDTLDGGAGADLFVLSADGVTDAISNFEIGVDMVDLSAWSGLYSTLQLEVTSLSNGAAISFGSEYLILRPSTGASLTLDDFLATDMLGIARIAPRAEQVIDPKDIPPVGTANSDVLEGSYNNDAISGLGGDDSVMGAGGHDRLNGDDGRDTVMGGAGNDTLDGGGSHDLLYGGIGDDKLYGGTGADTIYGENGNDQLWGDSSTDLLYGNAGNDTLTGGTGSDTLYGGAGDDRILSNTGVDLVYGGDGDDWISPGNGVDIAYGDGGNDTILGRTGWDTIHGGTGDDRLYGSEGRDLLFGNEDNDYLSGGSGFDTLWAGMGDDSLYGNTGEDVMYGEEGDDALYGASGNDRLVGGTGNDTLYGAQGRDTLEGGEGNDFLRGGTLGDQFIFNAGHNQDTISGLEWLDQIHLSTDLTGGITDAASIVATFQTRINGDMALDFGNGDQIIFDDDPTITELIDVLYTF